MANIYDKDWEWELAHQFITNNRCRKKAYVCSPLSADKESDLVENMYAAREYMFYAMKKLDMNARAPHAYLPMLLCDGIPAERALALQFGRRLLEESELILVCGNRISKGMHGEIVYTVSLNMPILTFDENLYLEIRKIVTRHGGNKKMVRIAREHIPMALPRPICYWEGWS